MDIRSEANVGAIANAPVAYDEAGLPFGVVRGPVDLHRGEAVVKVAGGVVDELRRNAPSRRRVDEAPLVAVAYAARPSWKSRTST